MHNDYYEQRRAERQAEMEAELKRQQMRQAKERRQRHMMIVSSIVGGIMLFGLIFGFSGAERVDAGQGCVILRNGQAVGTLGPGLKWRMPMIYSFACYPTRVQSLEVGAHEGSRANHRDSAVELKSSDGVQMSVTAMVYYRLPIDNLEGLYTEYGKTPEQLNDVHIQADVRREIRFVLEAETADDVYLGGLDRTSQQIEQRLRATLESKGVVLDSFALTTVTPSEAYRNAIQAQVEQQQEAARQQEVVKVREQEAEQKRVEAQGSADAAIIAAEGEAEANRIRSDSLTPEILQLEYYEALKSVDWAIFAPGDVQPMLPIDQPEPED